MQVKGCSIPGANFLIELGKQQKNCVPFNHPLIKPFIAMTSFRTTVLPIFLAALWISVSEFARNELLVKSYWVAHYEQLGLTFPSEPINGAVWGLWSLLFAVAIYVMAQRFSLLQTTLLAWFVGFVLMWVVVGNLGVLPYGLLYAAVPLSLFEAFLAALIIHRLIS